VPVKRIQSNPLAKHRAGFTVIQQDPPAPWVTEEDPRSLLAGPRVKGQGEKVKNNNNEALFCELLNESPRRVYRQ
jgi:hypothetical protein